MIASEAFGYFPASISACIGAAVAVVANADQELVFLAFVSVYLHTCWKAPLVPLNLRLNFEKHQKYPACSVIGCSVQYWAC